MRAAAAQGVAVAQAGAGGRERAGRAHRRDLALVALAGALLFLPGLGVRDLWNPDEARYAEVAREMRLAGSYAVPRLNGEVYSHKPPLLFWSILAASTLTGGVGETSGRLPSALAAIGSLVLVYRLGLRLFNRRAAWIAAAAFGTCFKILWQGRFGQIDMLLTFLVTLAVWFWVRGWTEGRPRLYYLFFAAAGLATLAKGPVGLLPPLLSILVFLAWTRQGGEIRRLRIGRGLLLWAAVVLAWLVPAGLATGDEYLRQIVFKQNVTRYADPWHHFQPPWYFLGVVPADFFPWSFLLPAGLALGWRARRDPSPEGRAALFALCWVAVTVLFFSISPAKRSVYVLTMYPGMALLVGAALDRMEGDLRKARRWAGWPLAALAVLVLLILAALPVAGLGRPEVVPLGGAAFVWMLAASLLPLAAGAALAAPAAFAGRLARAVGCLAAGMTVFWLTAYLLLVPRFDVVKSARGMSRELVARMGPGEPYAIYPRLDSTFLFYSGRLAVEVTGEKELLDYARRPGRVWLLIQRDDLARAEKKLGHPLPLIEVARDADLLEGYVLMTSPGPQRR